MSRRSGSPRPRSSTTRSPTPARRTRRTSSAGARGAARGAAARHEPRAVRHGADRAFRSATSRWCATSSASAGRSAGRLASIRGAPDARASHCPRGGGERHAPLGLGARPLRRRPSRFFDRFFVANWCPLAFMDESRTEPHPGQAAGRRARAALPRLRRGTRADRRRRSSRALVDRHRRASPNDGRARPSPARDVDIGEHPAPEPREPRCEPRLGRSRRRAASRAGVRAAPDSVGACADRRLSS